MIPPLEYRRLFRIYSGLLHLICSFYIVTRLESHLKQKRDTPAKIAWLQSLVLQSGWSLYQYNWDHLAARISGTQTLGFLAYNPLLCSLPFTVYLNIRGTVAATNILAICVATVLYLFQKLFPNNVFKVYWRAVGQTNKQTKKDPIHFNQQILPEKKKIFYDLIVCISI